ncbi:ATP-binding protein [Humibacter ginsengisoli]
MKVIDNLLAMVGATPGRKAKPPTYRAIADGLIITATKAEAWFEIPTANTDTMPELLLDDEVQSVIRVAGRALKDTDCHLKVIWSSLEGTEYVQGIEGEYTAGDWKRWVDMRAEQIDAMQLPQRHVLLGVTIAEGTKHDTSGVQQLAAPAFGIEQHRVRESDMSRYANVAFKLGRQLRGSRLNARLASAELLSWTIAREQLRSLGAVPRHGTIVGASLATLTNGHADPYTDHLRLRDEKGNVAGYVAVLPITDFPEEMSTPGEGEWLRTIADVSRASEANDGTAGDDIPVIVDASVRFRVLSRSQSLKLVTDARDLATEQRRSAGRTSAGDPGEETLDAGDVAQGLRAEIQRDGLILVRSHPRLVVMGDTYEELEANVAAVISHYADNGIQVSRGSDEQRELWLETLPGDQLRVDDLYHVQEGVGFFGSLFWGGSALSDASGGVIGHLTGSTPGLAHLDVTRFSKRDQPTTVGLIGLSGQGKTTLMQLLLLDAAFKESWCLLLDFKGDTGGLVDAAQRMGLPSQLMQVSAANAGAMDLFQALPIAEAPEKVSRQLALLAPRDLAGSAERLSLRAANRIAQAPRPTTWATIQLLAHSNEPDERELGEALVELAQTTLGRVMMGEPVGQPVLRTDPGLWVLQMPGLSLPENSDPPETWDSSQRLTIAAMRAVTTHALYMSSSHLLRRRSKVIGVPEAHRMLKTSEGRDFMGQTARMGRAFGTALLVDSQDADGISEHEGLVEQLAAVFGFRLRSVGQQDALARLLDLEPDDETRAWIRRLNVSEARSQVARDDETAESDQKGNCLVRVGTELAQIHVDLPSREIEELLDTNPDRAQQGMRQDLEEVPA